MKRTPYCEVLKEMGGKFVDFAGFDMPVQFEGILAEHKAVREGAGLFDVSHMGEFLFTGKGALATLQNLLCNDYEKIVVGKVKYSPMLNDEGGVVDDVLVYCINDECYFMCVNASNKDKDKVWAEAHLLAETEFKDLSDDTAQLAIQGPKAIKIIEKMFSGKVIPQKNYTFEIVDGILENKVILSRTGYTAEDGFEIYCDAKRAIELLNKVLNAGAEFELKLCGLGARDTLRLEGAMPLYGHEMNESTLATELGLDVFIKLNKTSFIGKQALLDNPPKMQRLGVKLIDRGIAREHSPVYFNGKQIGEVTSGTHSPTLGVAIAMVRVSKEFCGSTLQVEVRGKLLTAEVVPLPFYKRQK
ncbi:MAG: glycine cleavage system aminomethyltransferase GcvT [Clostridia bacterium]